MIAKQMKNESFRSTLKYVLEKEKAKLLDSNMGGKTPTQLAKEFGAARRLRPNLKRACGHIVLSVPHRDGNTPKGEYHEHLTDDQYIDIAQRWLKEMKFLGEGLHSSQYAIAFELDGVKVAGNKLGAAYSFPGLQRKRGVSYECDRDMLAIKKAAAGERIPLRQRKKPQLELS